MLLGRPDWIQMKHHASNPIGEATQQLLLLAIDRILKDPATTEQAQKGAAGPARRLNLPGVDGCVVGHLELLHDSAEKRGCELIKQVLASG